MRHWRAIPVFTAAMLLFACRCPVCNPPTPALERQLDRPIVITTPERGVSLADYCAILTDVTGVEIVVRGGRETRVTQWFDHVSLRGILDAITAAQGLQWEVQHDHIVIQ